MGADAPLDILVQHYENALLANGFTDFDLQIKWSVQLVEQHAFVRQILYAAYPWLLVDEYQDLGLPLHRIVCALAKSTGVTFRHW